MEATKIGIREFRAELSKYLASDEPVAVTRQGRTVGYFIPAREQNATELTAWKQASQTLDALLSQRVVSVDAVMSKFERARSKAKARRPSCWTLTSSSVQCWIRGCVL